MQHDRLLMGIPVFNTKELQGRRCRSLVLPLEVPAAGFSGQGLCLIHTGMLAKRPRAFRKSGSGRSSKLASLDFAKLVVEAKDFLISKGLTGSDESKGLSSVQLAPKSFSGCAPGPIKF